MAACSLSAAKPTASPCSSGDTFGPLAAGVDHTFRVRATDNLGMTDASPDEYTWHINAAPIVALAPSPSTQMVQYSDPISSVSFTVTDVDSECSDLTFESASYTKDGGSSIAGFPASLSLSAGSCSGGLPGMRTFTVSGIANVAPGDYDITVVIQDQVLATVSVTFELIVKKEDATATYTGTTFAWTTSSGGNATVALSATIVDSADGNPGDIRNARVTFKADSTTLCSDLPVGLVNPGDTTVGTAACTASLGQGTYTVMVLVKNYYTGNTSELLTVSPWQPNFITGGGHLLMGDPSSSAGLIAAKAGSKVNFGFNVKYNRKGSNPQGNANIIVRSMCLPTSIDPGSPGTGMCVYQIKSNAIDSLFVNAGANPPVAQFNSKANLQDVTDPLNPRPIAGNLILRLEMSDVGEPGANRDKLGVTVWHSSGGLWFASSWDGTKTAEQVIRGGNLSVH